MSRLKLDDMDMDRTSTVVVGQGYKSLQSATTTTTSRNQLLSPSSRPHDHGHHRASTNKLSLFLLVLISGSFFSVISSAAVSPKMRDVQHSPMVVAQGQNAALTCIVQDLGNHTLEWKKWEAGKVGSKVLTASEVILTSDDRYKVFHDLGGDVWVLAIANSRISDSGEYICEVNTNPVLRSFHNLTVISLTVDAPSNTSASASQPSGSGSPTVIYEGDGPFEEVPYSYKGMGSVVGHNYTKCCLAHNVSKNCLGFCTLRTILEGSTGEPTQCEDEFHQIVKCMADGRDHVPCCIRERVPDICQDLCRGEYTTVTDNVKTHFSCPTHIERTLSCIADGVELLPSQPLNVEGIAVSPTAINVSWSIPTRNGDTVTEYVVNVTTLRGFDAPYLGLGYGSEETSTLPTTTVSNEKKPKVNNGYDPAHANDSYMQAAKMGGSNRDKVAVDENAEDKVEAKMMQIKVHSDIKYTVISNLQPFTMYEISVRAFNIHGRSLPSVKVRTLTLAPGLVRPTPNVTVSIPDIKSCCRTNGVKSDMCVTKLCDPTISTAIEIPDLMICAPWTQTVFGCLADMKDHTPCCRERGITEQCAELCSGNFTSRLDYHYFKCLKYMADYKNCWMDGYGVLPSEPQHLRVSNIREDFAIIHWSPPSKLPETVIGYNIHYRPLSTYETEYHVVENIHYPHILENLYANAEYEVYVEAFNEHGVSQSSQRVVFRTESVKETSAELEAETNEYNETACCENAGLSETCLPLCSYDASMSDIRSLALTCAPEFHTLLRCAAGGRDHTQCCARRGVTDNCLGVCNARIPESLLSMAENCLPFIGNIVQCFEEGTDLLPGPVSEFHADYITDSSVAFSWDPPEQSNVTGYEVYYQVVNPVVTTGPIVIDSISKKSVNVSETHVEISNLTPNTMYQFSVVAHNTHGSSLPSSIIQLNVSLEQYNGSRIPGVVSAPHSLVVGSHSATWVQIIWQPPLFVHPRDKIHYKVYYRGVKESNYTMNETLVNSITIDFLKPNSQYIVYVTATTEKGESLPSETLIAWTDPAHSPFVETPRIQPANVLIEGRTMTIVCVALGDPTPMISLYINGRLVKQQMNRHLTQVIDNVTRDMDLVSCYADNGYGSPMQASRKIQISHAPNVSLSSIAFAHLGDEAILECKANSYPEPKLAFWKSEKRIPIIDGGKYSLTLETLGQTSYSFTLKIKNVSDGDGDEYFCHADNIFGEDTKSISLQVIHPVNERANLTSCCEKENVKPECMDACSLFMDIESVINKPECLSDFDKLMKCASDGRDHRSCCIGWGVPRRCLDWCRGEPLIHNADLCALQNTKAILKCFQENRDILPGPPQNLHFNVMSQTEVIISWDPPTTNPEAAALYRVFWRTAGDKGSEKIDTANTKVRITNLKPGMNYEAYVKAGNSYGTSILTPPLIFTTDDNSIASASTGPPDKHPENSRFHAEESTLSLDDHVDSPVHMPSGSGAGVGVGVTFMILILIAGAIGAVWFVRKKQLTKPPGAVAFENPSYVREGSVDPGPHINGDVVSSSTNGSVPSVTNGVNPANGWHVETLHTPRPETEVAPTFYEELRLGSEGVGFRRLK